MYLLEINVLEFIRFIIYLFLPEVSEMEYCISFALRIRRDMYKRNRNEACRLLSKWTSRELKNKSNISIRQVVTRNIPDGTCGGVVVVRRWSRRPRWQLARVVESAGGRAARTYLRYCHNIDCFYIICYILRSSVLHRLVGQQKIKGRYKYGKAKVSLSACL